MDTESQAFFCMCQALCCCQAFSIFRNCGSSMQCLWFFEAYDLLYCHFIILCCQIYLTLLKHALLFILAFQATTLVCIELCEFGDCYKSFALSFMLLCELVVGGLHWGLHWTLHCLNNHCCNSSIKLYCCNQVSSFNNTHAWVFPFHFFSFDVFVFLDANSTVFSHFMHNFRICKNPTTIFSFSSLVLSILHFAPRIFFMSILDFAEAWDCDLSCDFMCLSSSFL